MSGDAPHGIPSLLQHTAQSLQSFNLHHKGSHEPTSLPAPSPNPQKMLFSETFFSLGKEGLSEWIVEAHSAYKSDLLK